MSRDLFAYRCPYCNGLARHDSFYRDYICRDCDKRFTKTPEKYVERPIGDYINATRNLDRAADIYFSIDISHQDGYSRKQAREIIKAFKELSPSVVMEVTLEELESEGYGDEVGSFMPSTSYCMKMRVKDGGCEGEIRIFYDPDEE